jgi:hypothetical protein
MTAYKIEKNIPLPTDKPKGKWPFGEMEIGDSFFVGDRKPSSLGAMASQYGMRHKKKFSVLKDGEGYRVFRIA